MVGADPASVFASSPGAGPALRIGLLGPRGARPTHLAVTLLEDLRRALHIEIVAYVEVDTPSIPVGRLLGAYLERIDARYTVEDDPLRSAEYPSWLRELPAQAGVPDLWLCLPWTRADGILRPLPAPVAARHGTWFLSLGDSRRYADAGNALQEIIEEDRLTAAELRRHRGDPRDADVLARVECSTSIFPSLRLNRVAPLLNARLMLLQKLMALHASATDVRAENDAAAAMPRAPLSDTGLATWLFTRALHQLRVRMVRDPHDTEHWKVALRRAAQPLHVAPDTAALREFQWLESPRGTFWADPFLFAHEGQTWLFVEEMDYALGRAHISCGRVDEQGRIENMRPVVRRPYHLSYPQVFAADGQIYMVPEASGGGTVTLLRARSFPDEWEVACELLAFPAVDTTLLCDQGRWWMFTSPMVVAGHAPLTWIFTAAKLEGPWEFHGPGPAATSAAVARGAGDLLRSGGGLIRPSQDCAGGYGRALLFNAVRSLDGGQYREETVARIDGDWLPGLAGVHTYNRAGDWETIDGKFPVAGATVR